MSKKILEELKDAVVVGNMKKAKEIAEQIMNRGIAVNTALDTLMKAMKTVDERYERREYFVIDVASSASAMREAFKVLEPYLEAEPATVKGKIVIGSLKGNIQGLGKDIVAATLQSAGFQVINLGEDVAPEDFVKAVVREEAQIIAISISMEETIPYLKVVVDILKKENLRDKIKVIIGGNTVSEQTCREYELDAYAVDAQDCLKKVKALLTKRFCKADGS
ncbi:MAG: cobalamin-dependent protein [Candidatus Bathyarchaeota archaeon]|nr:cobalamin-dependent protein [Candidatus Bathyarchaeota archaeon]